MNVEERFSEMWQDYIANKLPPDKYSEFMEQVKRGDYDEMIKQYIHELLCSGEEELELAPERVHELLVKVQLSEQQASRLVSFTYRSKRKWYIAAAACLLVMISVSGLFFWRSKETREPGISKTETVLPEPVVNQTGKKFIKLPDGSSVILNKGSRLDYPDTFNGSKREVSLSGEGYFDIKRNPLKPFIVHTGSISTTVLGTAFNIEAYHNENKIVVTVTRGKVEVSNSRKTFGIIYPNQQLSVNTENDIASQSQVDAQSVVAWKERFLIFDGIALEDAVAVIGYKYHVTITISNEKLKKCRISATFLNNESLEQMLTVICGTVSASFEKQPDDQIIISGGDDR
jgi:ferric-dicitrate binding protein FerR (iron transport regulator)